MTHPVLAAINNALERDQEDGMRAHLGASVIGRACDREIWYSFRWATIKYNLGRQLRLFNRGHREEERFITWLRAAGINIDPIDPITGQQWRISAAFGHFGGSLDGILWNVPGVEQYGLTLQDRILGEFKTHGDKSFKKLQLEGMKKSKPEHFAQMQSYMKLKNLKLGLYLAINKNDDEIHAEFVPFDGLTGDLMIAKASHIIPLAIPPRRISEDPSWFACRFCDHKAICHLRVPMAKNCRTCKFSHPIEGGEWYCNKWVSVIPLENQKKGCEHHEQITT